MSREKDCEHITFMRIATISILFRATHQTNRFVSFRRSSALQAALAMWCRMETSMRWPHSFHSFASFRYRHMSHQTQTSMLSFGHMLHKHKHRHTWTIIRWLQQASPAQDARQLIMSIEMSMYEEHSRGSWLLVLDWSPIILSQWPFEILSSSMALPKSHPIQHLVKETVDEIFYAPAGNLTPTL